MPPKGKVAKLQQEAEKPKPKKEKNTGSEDLVNLGFCAALVGVIGVAVYLFTAGSKAVVVRRAGCNCPREWNPVCAAIPVSQDLESKLPFMSADEANKLKEMGYEGVPSGSDNEDPRAAVYRSLRTKTPQSLKVSYPNSCEAHCRGFEHEPGLCPGALASMRCLFDNDCPQDPTPEEAVCWHGFTLPSACAAGCVVKNDFQLEFNASELVHHKCPDLCSGVVCPEKRQCLPRPGKCFQQPCTTHKCFDSACNCSREWAPVCVLGVTYTNECFADCEGRRVQDLPLLQGECLNKDPGYPNPLPFPKPKQRRKRVTSTTSATTATTETTTDTANTAADQQ